MQDSPLGKLNMKQTNTGQVFGTVWYYKYTSGHYDIHWVIRRNNVLRKTRLEFWLCLSLAVYNSRQQRR
jgi:hypothetical protein